MKKLLVLLASCVLIGIAANAQPIVRSVDLGADLSKGRSSALTVTTLAQTVSFTSPCTNITINNTSTTETCYFQPFGGAASASNFPIGPGQAFSWTTTPGLTSVSLYATGSSTIGVLAH